MKKPAATAKTKLTLRDQRFVREYQLCGNGAKAAIAAGFSAKSAKEIAYQMMQRPHIREALNLVVSKSLSKLDVTVERVLQERARLAFFDPRKLFREDGTPIPIHELDDDAAAVVAGIKLDGRFVGRGKARKWVSTISEYKVPEKNPNLSALEKYLGMYQDGDRKDSPFNIIINLG